MVINTPSSNSFFKRRRTWVVTGCIVFISSILLVGWAISVSHAKAINIVSKEYSEVKKTSHTLLPTTKASRNERIEAIRKLSSINSKSLSCEPEWWSARYRALVQSAQDDYNRCAQQLKQLHATASAATNLRNYLVSEAEVTHILAGINITTSNEDWQVVTQKNVDDATEKLAAMAVSKENKVLIDIVKEKLQKVSGAWRSLADASSKQDKALYLAAKDQLTQAYVDIGAISDVSDTQIEKLLTELQSITKKL